MRQFRRELKQHGLRVALRDFYERRRGEIGYLILVLGIGLAVLLAIQDSNRQDANIISAGKEVVLRNCLDNNRDTRKQLAASDRNIPNLVKQGALSKELAAAALKTNAERRRLASDSRCHARADKFERSARRP